MRQGKDRASGEDAAGGAVEWSARVVFGAAALAVIVVVGLVLSLWAAVDDKSAEKASPGPSPSSSRGPYASVCGQVTKDFDKPDSSFPAHRRTLPSGAAIAELEGVGPCRVTDEGIPVGYVFAPKGAVLAAVNYASLVTRGGSSLPEAVSALQVPGRETDVMAADARRRAQPATGQAAVKGFKVLTTSKAREIRVTVAIEFPARPGVVVGWTLTAVWTGGDWKIAPMDRDAGWEMAPVASLARSGFTAWGF